MVTYDSLVAKFSIPPDKLKEECSDEVLGLVGRKFTTWKNAALPFELGDETVETISNGNHDEDGKRLELLRRWKQKFGFKSTNEKLIRCLLAAERADLATIVAKDIMGEPAVF